MHFFVDLYEGLKLAQRGRLEDQRGTEIRFEMPDFLKRGTVSCHDYSQHLASICFVCIATKIYVIFFMVREKSYIEQTAAFLRFLNLRKKVVWCASYFSTFRTTTLLLPLPLNYKVFSLNWHDILWEMKKNPSANSI